MTNLRPEQHDDAVTIEALLDASFGPGRFAKTAYRIREMTSFLDPLSYIATHGDQLVGSIRYSLLKASVPFLWLGPLVVHPSFRGTGVGHALMTKTLEVARIDGHGLVLLIGDEPYYRRAGFSKLPEGVLSLPGPYDHDRLLYLELAEGQVDALSGAVEGA